MSVVAGAGARTAAELGQVGEYILIKEVVVGAHPAQSSQLEPECVGTAAGPRPQPDS